MQNTSSALSRRKVTAGIAWSVPAVAAVAAAPFAAASPSCVYTASTEPVKYPGSTTVKAVNLKHAYGFEVTVTNPTRGRIRLSAQSFKIVFDKKGDVVTSKDLLIFDQDPCLGGKQLHGNSDLLVLEPSGSAGSERTFWLIANNTGNSANESGCITATLGVALTHDSVPVKNLCKSVEVDEACFDETPPASIC